MLTYHHTALGNQTRYAVATGITINSANTDVATFDSLPAKCRLRKVTVFDASTSLAVSVATLAVYTAAAAGGTNVVVADTLTALSAAAKCKDMTVVVTDYSATSTYVVRNVTAHGGAATVSVALEIEDLSA